MYVCGVTQQHRTDTMSQQKLARARAIVMQRGSDGLSLGALSVPRLEGLPNGIFQGGWQGDDSRLARVHAVHGFERAAIPRTGSARRTRDKYSVRVLRTYGRPSLELVSWAAIPRTGTARARAIGIVCV
jgi:hypothetical protein